MTFDDILIQNQIIDILSPNATINIKPLSDVYGNIWIDFIQMVPTQDADSLSSVFELLNPYDLSGKFISECTGDNFYIE